MIKTYSTSETTQNGIIDAALLCFGENGYKKASVNDIAAAANISKSMIFHYFGNKKTLYLHLIELCINTIKNEVNEKFDKTVTDFFDRIRLATAIKIGVMKKHPAIISFLGNIYHETHAEVASEIAELLSKSTDIGLNIIFEGLDTSKFKKNIDPQLVMKMITWFSEGYISKMPIKSGADIENMMQEFDECLYLLKNNFYKEELI